MIEVTLTATEFNEFVFDNVTQQTVAPAQVGVAHALVLILSDPTETEERPLSPTEQARAAQVGRKLWPGRRLIESEATFEFSVEEHALLQALLENAAARHPVLVLPDYFAMLAKVRNGGPLADDGGDDAGSDPD